MIVHASADLLHVRVVRGVGLTKCGGCRDSVRVNLANSPLYKMTLALFVCFLLLTHVSLSLKAQFLLRRLR